MTRPIHHPSLADITLAGILHALADPVRLDIVRRMGATGACPMNCASAAPSMLPKSTLSHHFRVLREAGLIRSEKRGAEVINTLRCTEINARFPGLIPSILAAADIA